MATLFAVWTSYSPCQPGVVVLVYTQVETKTEGNDKVCSSTESLIYTAGDLQTGFKQSFGLYNKLANLDKVLVFDSFDGSMHHENFTC